jgi:uncharacterized protein (DUF779 family)
VTVVFTRVALDVLERVRAARGDASLVFVFGEGCCEGTAPHLFANHYVGPTFAEVGRAPGVPVYADDHLRGLYANRTVTVDADEDPLADGFSAEVELGWRFVLRQPRDGSD